MISAVKRIPRGLKSAVKRVINSSRLEPRKSIGAHDYISAQDTLAAAQAKGISVCRYVEQLWEQEGRTQSIIDRLALVAGDRFLPRTALEIGPGTGRYLASTLNRYPKVQYEIYEIATDWAEWLAKTYPIISHAADGHSLKETPANSIDLIQVHGVFVYLPFLTTYEYLHEIVRVARAEAVVILDVISEGCMSDEIVREWLTDGARYPTIFPRDYLIRFFHQRQFKLMESFHVGYGAGLSEYFIFRRARADVSNAF